MFVAFSGQLVFFGASLIIRGQENEKLGIVKQEI